MHIPTRQGSLIYRGRPLVMGILNVTPDSFSDGGRYLDTEVAAEAALDMERQGAALIDLGACSTRPGSRPPSAEVEWSRLQPVLERIVPRLKIPVAIDTYRAQVFEAAWDLGASLLNDVTAARGDASMPDLLARTGAPAVLMHMQGEPNTMQARPHYSDVVVEVRAFFEERRRSLTASGVAPNQLIFDPGIGFGKSLEHNIELLRQVRTLVSPSQSLLIGCSRKSFLGMLLDREDPEEREYGTAATTAHAFIEGVHFVRVHDVRAAEDLIRVLSRIRSGTTDGIES